MTSTWLPAIAAAAIASLWIAYRARRAGLPLPEACAVAALPLGVLVLVGLSVWIKSDVQRAWSAARLAPALGILRGYPLYSPADHGPINGWLYGPVSAILWLPAAIARNALNALRIAESINLLVLSIPLLAACLLAAGPGLSRRAAAAWCAVGGSSVLLLFYPTWYMVAVLSSDAAAVGFGVLACALLSAGSATRGRLAACAGLTALAIWSKQVEAPLALAQLVWLAMAGRRQDALRYLGWLAAWGAGLAALFVAFFGFQNMYFNMWVIPTSQYFAGGAGDFADRTLMLLASTLPATALALWVWRQRKGAPFPILLVAALVLLPGCVLTSLKVGADTNSIHSYYYLIAAAACAIAELAGRRPGRTALPAAIAALAFLAAGGMRAEERMAGPAPLRWANNEAAYQFALAHPGRSYFPADPLATLLADGKFYHMEYGILDRVYAGRRPGPEQLAEGLPPGLQYIVYPLSGNVGLMGRLLASRVKGVSLAGHWTVLHYAGPVDPAEFRDAWTK
ncbi:MAG TPA: hypothetical protein VGG34_14975 [Opitutaceae bacterium]|jgi:hypothetical protein